MKTASIFLILFAIGCSDIQKRTYDVTVKNDSTRPVTIWLTKNGPLFEIGWKSPEDLAIESPKMDERIAGVFVPVGKTASTGPVNGQFAPGTNAILRVYLGQKNYNELLAMSRGHPDRLDLVLSPGVNQVVVSDEGQRIKATVTP